MAAFLFVYACVFCVLFISVRLYKFTKMLIGVFTLYLCSPFGVLCPLVRSLPKIGSNLGGNCRLISKWCWCSYCEACKFCSSPVWRSHAYIYIFLVLDEVEDDNMKIRVLYPHHYRYVWVITMIGYLLFRYFLKLCSSSDFHFCFALRNLLLVIPFTYPLALLCIFPLKIFTLWFCRCVINTWK
jgi:hypothetical protein